MNCVYATEHRVQHAAVTRYGSKIIQGDSHRTQAKYLATNDKNGGTDYSEELIGATEHLSL